ncbi:MAG: hypothetical protein EZS28_038776 [Streblomastix strix]|uniref:Uncharacterized protein n=1 Tax=Streblomastix strix TaxID=222440 RepID=A0A5J4U554_9EUKA|nr:MAG: hypothetical protein EZS28_038776 [Streblomastix strix]
MQERTEMIDTKDLMVVIFSILLTELQKVSAVASTIKAKIYIKTFSYDQSEDKFIEKWLDQVFCEALQIRCDNKFANGVSQRYEVLII